MYCNKCGAKVADDARFCEQCGASLGKDGLENASIPQQDQTHGGQKQPSGKKAVIVAAVAAAVILLAAGGIGVKYYMDYQKKLAEEQAEQQWNEYVVELNSWRAQMDSQKENYIFSPEEERRYESMCDDIQRAVNQQTDISIIDGQKRDLEQFYEKLAASNKEQIEAQKAQLEEADVEFAMDSDLKAIESCRQRVADGMAKENYREAMDALLEWEDVIALSNTDFDSFQVAVRQYDLSEYPNIKLYVDVTDKAGNFVDNLGSDAFFINEGRTIEGMSRASVIAAAKLNQNEGISIGLVADASGSMDTYMEETKNAVLSFVNSVQFEKGDEIEIVKFDEQAYICQSFTRDISEVTRSIQEIYTGGSTRLYDTLINEIARIQSCSNAKCIIGFTDGMDNMSVYTAQDVVDRAVASRIPVFLIGIGPGCDSQALSYIAQSTQGLYSNIDDVSSLANIYNAIYTEQKEVYYLEYTLNENDSFSDRYYADIFVRTNDRKGGYCKQFSFNSMDFFKTMYNRFLIAGIDCQTKGERNLLDSGLIVTTQEAYNNPDCVAYQSQKSIDSGGVGSSTSDTFEVLIDYDVIEVVKDGDGYIVYGMSNYDVSKIRTYKRMRQKEKEYILQNYGAMNNEQELWLEENLSNYEKLRMVKDTDGKWKFYSRVYERNDGGDAISINEVYRVVVRN